MRRAVVTGATGYLGSALVGRLVDAGWSVAAIVRPTSDRSRLHRVRDRVQFVVDDGKHETLLQALSAQPVEVVFHLAARSGYEHRPGEVASMLEANVVFGARLLEAMSMSECKRFVSAATYWQHYDNADYSPVSLYAASKQAFEDIARFYCEARGLAAVFLTLFDIYGPDDPRPKVFNQVLAAAKAGQAVALSPGDQLVDMVHVEDAARAFLRAGDWLHDNPAPGLSRFLVSAGQRLPLRQLVERFVSIHSLRVDLLWGARPHRAREVMRPWDGIPTLPCWRPELSLDDGLRGLVGAGT